MPLSEFEIIRQFFTTQKTTRPDAILGVGDDCAILKPAHHHDLVMTMDNFIADVHFDKHYAAEDIGYKALAISLSDIAAMGAEPAWVLLSLTLPEANEKWLTHFAHGFFQLAEQFSLQLVGGNTAQGAMNISTQVTGFLPQGVGLHRNAAQVGDLIYVTGTIGDAGLALQALQKKIKLSDAALAEVLPKLFRPAPRIKEGILLRDIAHSAIDISDGLAADLNHLLQASSVGATIHTSRLPLSKTLRTQIKPEHAWDLALGAGDDYELCFTVARERQAEFEFRFGSFNCGYICIGTIEAEPGLRVMTADGKPYHINNNGYVHFEAQKTKKKFWQ